MLFTKGMLSHANAFVSSSTVFAQAYGAGTYSCGNYQEGCTTSTGTTTPTAPNTGMLLTEPSFVVPGSLLLAIIIALITTTIAKTVRRRKSQAK